MDEDYIWPYLVSVSENLKKPVVRSGFPLYSYKPNLDTRGEEENEEYKKLMDSLKEYTKKDQNALILRKKFILDNKYAKNKDQESIRKFETIYQSSYTRDNSENDLNIPNNKNNSKKSKTINMDVDPFDFKKTVEKRYIYAEKCGFIQ